MSKALKHPLGDSCEEVRLRIEGKASSGTRTWFLAFLPSSRGVKRLCILLFAPSLQRWLAADSLLFAEILLYEDNAVKQQSSLFLPVA